MARSAAESAAGEGAITRSSSKRQRERFPSASVATRVLSIFELAEMVIQHLRPSHKDLAAAASVNKLFHSLATPLLYETIVVGEYANCREARAALWCSDNSAAVSKKDEQLRDLLCIDKTKAAAVRHITFSVRDGASLELLLHSCTAILSLSYVCNYDDDFDEASEPKFTPWHSTSLGMTLRSLSLHTHEELSQEDWLNLLGSFRTLESLELVGRMRYANVRVERLPLRATVRKLTLHDDDQNEGYWSGHIRDFVHAFTTLEHLEVSLWIEGFHLPSICLPPTLRSFELHDDYLTGYVDVLRRLSDPSWLPLLRKTPVLNASKTMVAWIERDYREGVPYHDIWTTLSELEGLMEAARNGLKHRAHWEEGGKGEASWNELLSLLREFPVNETEVGGAVTGDESGALGDGSDAAAEDGDPIYVGAISG